VKFVFMPYFNSEEEKASVVAAVHASLWKKYGFSTDLSEGTGKNQLAGRALEPVYAMAAQLEDGSSTLALSGLAAVGSTVFVVDKWASLGHDALIFTSKGVTYLAVQDGGRSRIYRNAGFLGGGKKTCAQVARFMLDNALEQFKIGKTSQFNSVRI